METKPWWKSVGIWANVGIFAAGLYEAARPLALQHFNVVLPPIPPEIMPLLGGLGVYGRARATTKIG